VTGFCLTLTQFIKMAEEVSKEYKMFDAIQVTNAYKKFGKESHPLWKGKTEPSETAKVVKVAVDHVSLNVHEAEIFGVLGPNGSGKSTLIRLIATLLLPDAGSIKVFGQDVVSQPMQVQRMINRVSVEASFFKKLSPMENLLYGARLYGMQGKETRTKVNEILSRLGLDKNTFNQPMEEMSRPGISLAGA
jgi:ABC-2 type transport system ATP-binding protein